MHPSETHDEAVYDAYLTACAEGTAEPPAAVFRRNPDLGAVVRARIEELWRATRPDASAGTAAPSRIGPYRLVERLDSGGMGTVFRAVREDDGAEVAVKVLRPELAGSAHATERLRREALALSRLRHPNVVRVHGFGQDAGVAYLVLDLVPGRGLEEIAAEAATRGELLPFERVARWGSALARGLEAAHSQGVVHRDVKPSNVRVTPDDTPLLLDFGIARVPETTPGALTTTFAGSPFYAAPEQLTGARVDGRADVYGLCATLYQCLTGRVPFSGDRFDAVLRRVLVETPVPVRRLAPHVPRSLETVVLAGLEKDPDRRPPSAAALADDLDAALRGGRIRSRRPGPLRLAARWARRRPVAASATAFGVLGVVAVFAGSAILRRAERERVEERARAAVREAARRTQAYAAGASRQESLSRAIHEAGVLWGHRWRPDAEMAKADAAEEEFERLRREREAEFHGILALLDGAERQVPDLDGADACRADLHFVRWREATAAGDETAAAFYRRLVERADPGGAAARQLASGAGLSVHPDPPDAEVHLFRTVPRSDLVPSGGKRLVAVPFRSAAGPAGGPADPAGLPPAPWALRVVRGAGRVREGTHVVRLAGHPIEDCVLAAAAAPPLRPLDRLVEVGGVAVRDLADAVRLGAPGPERVFSFARGGERIEVSARALAQLGVEPVAVAEVARRGGVGALLREDGADREVLLLAGLDVRVTAAPLFPGPASRIAPGETIRLPPAEYVVLLRAPGRLDTRMRAILQPAAGTTVLRARLPLPEERPPGCVRVVEGAPEMERQEFWIQERETTSGEYLEFLNDAATRREIDASPVPVRVPRHEVDPPLWPRGDDGAFRLPAGLSPETPVLGISHEDARAFAAWRSARAAARGEAWTWRLPTWTEWTAAAAAGSPRVYPFGPQFRPRWASSCFSRPENGPEPAFSYPVDESVFGVYDLCGGAMEWVEDWYDERRGLRRLAGGSWAQGDAVALQSYNPRGARPDRADREFGVRFVVERAP